MLIRCDLMPDLEAVEGFGSVLFIETINKQTKVGA